LTSPKTKSDTKRAKKVYDEYHDDKSGITSFSYDTRHYIRDPENNVFLLDKNREPLATAGSWDATKQSIMFEETFEKKYEKLKSQGNF